MTSIIKISQSEKIEKKKCCSSANLCQIQRIQWIALLADPFDSADGFGHQLRLLSKIQIQDWNAAISNFPFGQRIHQQHDPYGSLTGPITFKILRFYSKSFALHQIFNIFFKEQKLFSALKFF